MRRAAARGRWHRPIIIGVLYADGRTTRHTYKVGVGVIDTGTVPSRLMREHAARYPWHLAGRDPQTMDLFHCRPQRDVVIPAPSRDRRWPSRRWEQDHEVLRAFGYAVARLGGVWPVENRPRAASTPRSLYRLRAEEVFPR